MNDIVNIEFDDKYCKYEKIILDIFNNGNLNYDLNDGNILNIIGLYYEKNKNYKEMEAYFIIASRLDNTDAMNNLGLYYNKIEDYERMKKYYLMALEKKSLKINNLCVLGHYYQTVEFDFDKMKLYYLMAIELKSKDAMFNMAIYYQFVNYEPNEMKKYYLMAIELDDDEAMYYLGCYYQSIEKNYYEMKKYYLMAIELNNENALINICNFYDIEIQYHLLKKCKSLIAQNKIKELEKNIFFSVNFFREFIEYYYNPNRLLKICEKLNMELNDYMDLI